MVEVVMNNKNKISLNFQEEVKMQSSMKHQLGLMVAMSHIHQYLISLATERMTLVED